MMSVMLSLLTTALRQDRTYEGHSPAASRAFSVKPCIKGMTPRWNQEAPST